MEPVPMGAFPCGDWDPLSVLLTNEDLDLTQRAAENHMYDMMSLVIPEAYFSASPEDYPANQTVPGIWEGFLDPTVPADGSSLMGSSQESSCASGLSSGFCRYYSEMPVSVEDQADNEASLPSVKRVQPKRKCSNSNSCAGETDGAGADAPPNPKKRKPRATNDKGKKNVQPKKKQTLAKPNGNEEEEEEEGNIMATQEGQSLSNCSSEEDRVSQQLRNGESAQNSNGYSALNADGKTTRASRGTATDPQSLYARRRRERINERLKILQNLIPNGTKVDISTMLEEAVHYVKFLQLQIKLLSSNELWMYAPIAYNGMDIGLNQILPPQLP